MNFCRHCGAALDGQITTCPHCQQPLQDDGAMPVALKEAPVLSLLPDTSLPSTEPLHESLARYVAQVVEQKQILARLRQDMQEQLEQQRLALENQLAVHRQEVIAELTKKEDKVALLERPQLVSWQRRGMDIFLILAGLAFVVNLALITFYSKPNHRTDTLALGSTALIIFGGFYLAYDLLGRQNGPLVRLTAYVTYALIGALGASIASALLIGQDLSVVPLASRFQHFDTDPVTGLSTVNDLTLSIYTRGALFCLFWGAIIGLSGKLLTTEYKNQTRFAWLRRSLTELFWCLALWTLFFSMFLPIITPEYRPLIEAAFLVTLLPSAISAIITFALVRLYFFILKRLTGIKASHHGRYRVLFILSTLIFPCVVVPFGLLTIVLLFSAELFVLFLPVILGLVTFVLVRLYRFFIVYKLLKIKDSRPGRYRAVFVAGTLITFLCIAALPTLFVIAYIPLAPSSPSSLSSLSSPSSLWGAVAITFGFALSGTVATILAPFTVNWINCLDERRLGGIGLFLVSVGTFIGIVPALLDLLLK